MNSKKFLRNVLLRLSRKTEGTFPSPVQLLQRLTKTGRMKEKREGQPALLA